MNGIIDSHTHLDRFAREGSVPEVLTRARDAGVSSVVTIGTEPADWALYRDLAAEYRDVVHFTVGLHPCSVDADWEQAVGQLPSFLRAGELEPVAVGEIGLDRFHLPKEPERAAEITAWQEAAFRRQLALAIEYDLPVVIHSRGAFDACVAIIDDSGIDWKHVVFHCFAEGPEEMQALLKRGGWASFTGIITYKNAESVRQAALTQGLGRLMIETDAPYLTPMPHRGKPNEVSYLRHTAEFCAGLFGVDYSELATVTNRNTRAFFALD